MFQAKRTKILLGILMFCLIVMSVHYIRPATLPKKPLSTNISKSVNIPSSLRIPILMYHYVEYVQDRGDKIRISLNIEPWLFEAQLKTLSEAGYTFLTPSDIPKIFDGQMPMPTKPIILSFDDGYRDFYTDAFPIMKKYHAKGIQYVVPGFLDQPNNLTRSQLKELSQSGLVEIGAHTISHAYLKGLDLNRVIFEIQQSKLALEKELGRPIISFAYPYGAFDPSTIQIVKDFGFQTAVSTDPGINITQDDLFFIYRLRPGHLTGQPLLQFLTEAK